MAENNLIQKLDDQSWDYAWNSTIRENESVGEIKREKFAELIIKECASFLELSRRDEQDMLSSFGLTDTKVLYE